MSENDKLLYDFIMSESSQIVGIKYEDKEYPIDDTGYMCKIGDQSYCIYRSIQSLRTHNSVADYSDTKYDIPVIISMEDALYLIQKFVNLTQHSITIVNFPPNATVEETLKDIIEKMQSNEKISKLLAVGVSLLNEKTLVDAFSVGTKSLITLEVPNNSISSTLTYIEELIYSYVTYDDCLLHIHPLNSHLSMLLYCFRCLLSNMIILPRNIFVNPDQLVVHYFVSLIMDLFTDRCSKELFINRRSDAATNILKKYHMKYPILTKINTIEQWNLLPSSFYDEIAHESVSLMPYILTYNMSDENRILCIYNHLKKAIDTTDEHRKLLSAEEFYLILTKFAANVNKSYYSYNVFLEVLPIIQSVLSQDERNKINEIVNTPPNVA